MQQKKTLSKLVGSALAHIQSLADDVFHFGFKKLREMSEEKVDEEKEAEAPAKESDRVQCVEDGLVTVVKKVASFLGDSGEAYYETYEGIKAKKAQRSQKKEHHEVAEK